MPDKQKIVYEVDGKQVDANGKEIKGDAQVGQNATLADSQARSDGGQVAGLDGLDFASDEAAELASREGLSLQHFEGIDATGKGGLTSADVRKAVANRDAANQA